MTVVLAFPPRDAGRVLAEAMDAAEAAATAEASRLRRHYPAHYVASVRLVREAFGPGIDRADAIRITLEDATTDAEDAA